MRGEKFFFFLPPNVCSVVFQNTVRVYSANVGIQKRGKILTLNPAAQRAPPYRWQKQTFSNLVSNLSERKFEITWAFS